MANVRKAAPKADFNQQADTMHIVADAAAPSADTDLLRIPGKPKFAPQRTILYNQHATNAATVILTPEKGTDLTFIVNAGHQVYVDTPIKKIEDTGTTGGTCFCMFFWWDPYGCLDWNPET